MIHYLPKRTDIPFIKQPVLTVYAYKMDNAIIICSHENKKGWWFRRKLLLVLPMLRKYTPPNDNANAFT